jgi:hypothetical protein
VGGYFWITVKRVCEELHTSRSQFFRRKEYFEKKRIIYTTKMPPKRNIYIKPNWKHPIFNCIEGINNSPQNYQNQKNESPKRVLLKSQKGTPNNNTNTFLYRNDKLRLSETLLKGDKPKRITSLHKQRRVLSLYDHWAKTLCLRSHRNGSKHYLLAIRYLGEALAHNKYLDIKEAMNVYNEILETSPLRKIKQVTGYSIALVEFFNFSPSTKKLLLASGHLKGIDGWFKECLHGVDHALNCFHGLEKDVYPKGTKLIKKLYGRLYSTEAKTKYNNLEEKGFRHLTRMLMWYMKGYAGYWFFDTSPVPKADKIIHYFFTFLEDRNIQFRQISPGVLSLDWVLGDFITWCKSANYILERPRRKADARNKEEAGRQPAGEKHNHRNDHKR